ncbi:MAG: hypothetical protein R2724_20365 [Bryobacterales bacterium]
MEAGSAPQLAAAVAVSPGASMLLNASTASDPAFQHSNASSAAASVARSSPRRGPPAAAMQQHQERRKHHYAKQVA